MTTVVLDLERLKYLECGLGQFSLHLGRAILAAAERDIEPIFILPPRGESHFARGQFRAMTSTAWRRDAVLNWLRPLVACWPRRSQVDVWHVTQQDSKYWPLDVRVPVVYTVHDLNF